MLTFAEKGESFYGAVEKVKDSLQSDNDYCDLEFNDIRVRVSKNSRIDDFSTIYNLKHTIRRLQAGYKN
jgi:hypothetical protein